MRHLLPSFVALTLSCMSVAQRPEPAPQQPTAPVLVSMSAWLGQKLHVREPLRSAAGLQTNILRPVAIVDDLEIDTQGRVTKFVLRPLTAEPANAKIRKRTQLVAKDVTWLHAEKALVTGLGPSAVVGLGKWKQQQPSKTGACASVLATQLLAITRLHRVAGRVSLPRNGAWIHSATKRVLWLTVKTVRKPVGRAQLLPWAACTVVRPPRFLRLQDPTKLASAPILDKAAIPPIKAKQVQAAEHFGVNANQIL